MQSHSNAAPVYSRDGTVEITHGEHLALCETTKHLGDTNQDTEQGIANPGSTKFNRKSTPRRMSSKIAPAEEYPSGESPAKRKLLSHPITRWLPYKYSKCLAWSVGLIILGGVVIGIIELVQFMKHKSISFKTEQDSTSSVEITTEELAAHNTADDCWVAYHGNVYDLTYYADRHPAGPNWITDYAGTDATKEYAAFHSKNLLQSISQYIVGPFYTCTEGTGDGPQKDEGCHTSGVSSPDMEVTPDMLALHNTPEDCWVVYHGSVYDLTEYAGRHPAGPNWITDYAGTDATEEYAQFHSEGLLQSVSQYYVGPLTPTMTDSDNHEEISFELLALHNTPEDCWVAYHGKVYDLTDYADRHPAGPLWVTDYAGTDATKEYAQFHSEGLLESVSQYFIGPLSTTDTATGNDSTTDEIGYSQDDALPNTEVSLEILNLHNTPDDCWVAYHGKVYDLTDYADRHPAGPGWVTDYAGTDATEEYAQFHSESLLQSVSQYYVGQLSTTSSTTATDYAEPICSNCVTVQELREHDTSDDCWVAYHGNVYDLTDYADLHPAGSRWITVYAGTDATEEYSRFHNEGLLESVSKYLVGPLITV